MNFLRFAEFDGNGRGCLHGFTLRSNPPMGTADIPQILQEAGLPENYVMGEQTHGAGVAGVGVGVAGALERADRDSQLKTRSESYPARLSPWCR